MNLGVFNRVNLKVLIIKNLYYNYIMYSFNYGIIEKEERAISVMYCSYS